MKILPAQILARSREARFTRRGAAMAIDMAIVAVISIPIMLLVTWIRIVEEA